MALNDVKGMDIEVSWKKLFDVGIYALPGYIRVVKELPRTDTQKIKKPVLLHEFIERNPQRDDDGNDLVYFIEAGILKEFKTSDYERAMERCTDPLVRSRFAAVTRRQDLF